MSRQNLAKNTVFYTGALAMQKALSFLYIVFLARTIGVENMGRLSFALSFTTIFAIFLDWGLQSVIIREISRDRAVAQKYVSNVFGLKIFGSVFIGAAACVMINLMGYEPLVKNMVYVSALVMILDSFTLNFYGAFRGHQVLNFESIGTILNQLSVMIFGFLAVKLNFGLVSLVVAYLIGSAVNFLFSGGFLAYRLKIFLWPKINFSIAKKLIMMALPFAVSGIFTRIYSNIDIVLLSKLANNYEVGLYSVAYKTAFALQFIGMASLAGIFPAFCHHFIHAREMLVKSFNKSFYYLMMLSLPLAFGAVAISDKIIGPMFGAQYRQSVLALNIMMISIPLSFLCFPLGALLNAANRQKTNTILLGIMAALSIVLNVILIPKFGHLGSAVAVPITYVFLFFASFLIVGEIIAYDKRYLFWSFVKILTSCLIMFLAAMFLKSVLHFVWTIGISAAVYVFMLYVLKGFSREDLDDLKTIFFSAGNDSAEVDRAPEL